MRGKVYPSDLTDRQWAVLAPLLPPPAPRGRRRSVDPRAILDGILYVLGTGGSWRSLPRDLPKWITVYASFRRWQRDGTWARLHTGDHPPPTGTRGFAVVPRRWTVERTFAWLHRNRRLLVRYDRDAAPHQAFLSLGTALVCWHLLHPD